MRLWLIYLFPWLVCLFCWRKYVDQSWDSINRSQTHECGNWGWGRAIPRKGLIHKWEFRCSAVKERAWTWKDFWLLESLAEEVHHVKEDKARNYLHSKLTDTVSSDMLAYQKHDDSQSDEGLRRRHPLTHFQVHCKKRLEIFPSPTGIHLPNCPWPGIIRENR
jgi:hypothetical protein